MSKACLIALLLCCTAFAKEHKRALAFDPYSILQVKYFAKDCKQNEAETVCKRAYFEFGAIKAHPELPISPDAPSSFVAPQERTGGKYLITFHPSKCDELPTGEYVCKDVRWSKK